MLFPVGGFFVMETIEPRLRKYWRQPEVIWKRVPGRGKSSCKGPEGGRCLECVNDSCKAGGAEWMRVGGVVEQELEVEWEGLSLRVE